MTTQHTHTPAGACAALAPAPRTNTSTSKNEGSVHRKSPASQSPAWTIEPITASSLPEASAFVNASRRELFPSLGHDALLDDAQILKERGGSCVLVARSREVEARGCGRGKGRIVAAIAYTPFDYRFAHLPYPLAPRPGSGSCSGSSSASASASGSANPPSTANSSSSSLHTPIFSPADHPCKTVEVQRLFVLPQYRRHGLAASLFQSLRAHAVASGVRCMYLHTHPFLPGAIRFWEKQGFDVVCVDEQDEVWRTHHMQMMLGEVGSSLT